MRLKTGDIDCDQKIIRVVQSKGRKDRHVMLSPTLLDLLQTWWGERTDITIAAFPGANYGCSRGAARACI